jgi:hypothetical protein
MTSGTAHLDHRVGAIRRHGAAVEAEQAEPLHDDGVAKADGGGFGHRAEASRSVLSHAEMSRNARPSSTDCGRTYGLIPPHTRACGDNSAGQCHALLGGRLR